MFKFNTKTTAKPPQNPPQLAGDDFTPPPQQQIYTQYDPLKDLATLTPKDNLFTHQIYHLPTAPEHFFEEEANRNGRNLSGDITFYTGTAYALGSIFGGVKGTLAGLKAAERGDSMKIRVNRVLNSGGLVGRRFGNSAGVLGVLYSLMGGAISHMRDGVHDDLGSVLAGVGSGATFRVFHGVRSVAVGGLLGGVVVVGALGGTHLIKKYGPHYDYNF